MVHVGDALTLVLERWVVERLPPTVLALGLARGRADRRLEVERRVGTGDANGQRVREAVEARPGRATAARGEDEAAIEATEDLGVGMVGEVRGEREQWRRA